MKAQLANCFVSAAADVLAREIGEPVRRDGLLLEANPYTTDDVTAVVGIGGQLRGSMYLSMAEATALALVSRMLGQPMTVFDELAQSGIAELANVIAGTASVALSELDHETTITPPLMLIGAGARISTVDIQRIVVPLETACGALRVHVALRPGA